MKDKWFYGPQKDATQRLDNIFNPERYRCDYQIVTKDRVIEQYSGLNEKMEAIQVQVQLVKHGKDNCSVFIFELKPLHGFHH